MFKITIEKLLKREEGKNYDSWDRVFEQTIENLDVSDLVVFINRGDERKRPSSVDNNIKLCS